MDFCPMCDTALDDALSYQRCPNCGFVIPKDGVRPIVDEPGNIPDPSKDGLMRCANCNKVIWEPKIQLVSTGEMFCTKVCYDEYTREEDVS